MVRRIETIGNEVIFSFEGQPVNARAGDSVAAALTAVGISHLRDSVVSGSARGVYCMMGACFDCLVEVDGVPNRQACMTEVRHGLDVRRQSAVVEVRS